MLNTIAMIYDIIRELEQREERCITYSFDLTVLSLHDELIIFVSFHHKLLIIDNT